MNGSLGPRDSASAITASCPEVTTRRQTNNLTYPLA
jgi:hypothetical protein